jgi:glycosyltransferase involved in cell wall biosynthesis
MDMKLNYWSLRVDMSKLIVAIPAFNEESTLPKVLKEIKINLSDEEDYLILLVDDGSTDRTVEVAENAEVDIIVCHDRNLGVAKAYKTAICSAVSYGADVICTIDADGQFKPNEIVKLVQSIRKGDADLVIGSRFIGKEKNNGVPTINKVANKLMALLISFIIGRRIHDTESGFRALSRETAKDLELLGRVSFSNDMILDLSKKGRRIKEVPVSVIYYQARVSKVITGFLKYGFRSLCLIALKVLSSRFSLTNLVEYQPPTKVILGPRFESAHRSDDIDLVTFQQSEGQEVLD